MEVMKVSNQKIRIRLKGYDHEVVDQSAKQIVETAQQNGARVSGPIPLPTERNLYTVIRSPHKDKDSREQFEMRTHKRLIDILEPKEPGFGYEFVDATVGGVIPKEYIPSVDKGIQEALESGVIAGYPVQDIKVTLVDGSYHEVDSSEAAFKIAGSMAIKEALKKSDPVLLEPMEAVEVETPEQYMGDVMGNLSSRRGKIEGMEDRSNTKVIKAKVPLGEMFGYTTDLRSQTQGRASYTMQFDSYEPVPKNIKDEIVSKNGGSAS